MLKKTEDNRWAHVLCALYVPEIKFGNVTTMEPIIVGNIPVSSFNSKICYICEENKVEGKQWGVCLQCSKPSCKVVFHVSCGQARGLLVEEQGELWSVTSWVVNAVVLVTLRICLLNGLIMLAIFCSNCTLHLKLVLFKKLLRARFELKMDF